ncbi:hypothetical protein BN1723_004997 [Verticillium longisporum]|uniref:Uncharacterized protein n=1 Tax=Verticillium longisporum TaxID=100787 RepID=A0A0G4N365_VERLO|nr:hypothetical protein BN1723_004997 [Verticillium longisporum]
MLARVGSPVCLPVCLLAFAVSPGPAALMHDGDDALDTRQGTCSKGGTRRHGGTRLKGHT